MCCAVLCLVAQSSPTLCDPMDSSPSGFSVHGDSPGKKTGVGSLSLLQRIFPTQESNRSFPHCKRILYQLSYQGSLLPVWLAGSCTWICPASNILKHPHLLCIDLPLGAYFLLRTDDCSVGWAPPNGRNPHCLILIFYVSILYIFAVVVISLFISALANFIYKGPDNKYFWLWSPVSITTPQLCHLWCQSSHRPKKWNKQTKIPQRIMVVPIKLYL